MVPARYCKSLSDPGAYWSDCLTETLAVDDGKFKEKFVRTTIMLDLLMLAFSYSI